MFVDPSLIDSTSRQVKVDVSTEMVDATVICWRFPSF